jgi:hypothetical protein
MRRSLSAKKASADSRRDSKQKRRSIAYAETERKPREKVYVPVYTSSSRFFASPHEHYQPQAPYSSRPYPTPKANYINTH